MLRRFAGLIVVLLACFGAVTPVALTVSPVTVAPDVTGQVFAGFRASRTLSSYPNEQFPNPDYWVRVGREMAGRFPSAAPGGVWIVSLYQENGTTQLSFPSSGTSYPYLSFSDTDHNEPYLTDFDQSGLKVWLQVEPGAADVETLIDLVMQRYKHHACVIGFGIDVEWYRANAYPDGRKITDNEAEKWEQRLKSLDTNYSLFLKHWDPKWMPPSYRGGIFFIDDSQQFSSIDQMITEFTSWGAMFAPNPVGFQFGYESDRVWWGRYPDPAKTVGNAILANVANAKGFFWVDFTIATVFPVPEFGSSAMLFTTILLMLATCLSLRRRRPIHARLDSRA